MKKHQKIYLENHFSEVDKIIKQNKNKRNLIKSPKLIDILHCDSNNIYKPWLIDAHKNYLYIVDYSNFKIHKICLKNLKQELIFGKGKGRGSGGLLNVNDIAFGKDKLFLADGKKRTIEIYSTNGKFIKSIKIKAHPHRILINTNTKRIISQNTDDRVRYFHLYDYNGNLLKKFGGPLVNKELNSPHYHEFSFLQLSDSTFLQLTRVLGVMGFYRNKKLRFIKETIDGIQDPNILEGRPTLFPASTAELYHDNFILLATKYKDGITEHYCDIYDKESLSYLYSFEISDPCGDITVHNNKLILRNYKNNNLYIYLLQQ